jgi:phosphatidate cytidylyltransferase
LTLKNITQRTISGIFYLIIIIGSLFLGEYAFGAVFLLIGLLALVEYYSMNGLAGFSLNTIHGLIAGTVIYILAFLNASQAIELQYLTLIVLIPMLLFILTLYFQRPGFRNDLPLILLGICYIFIPLALMLYLAFPAGNGYAYTHRIVLGILILVWINDTGAYITGITLGRHKLFPRVSPKKSWEGFIGGTLLTFVPAFWMDRFIGILSLTDWIVLAAIVSVFGVYGDLAESLMKRNAKIKDSGNLIPGHGGVLDRMDSILFVMPVSFVYLLIAGV